MVTMIITTTAFLLLILLIRAVFQEKMSARLQYALWLLVAVKLLIFPVPFIESNFSVMNLFETVIEKDNTWDGQIAGGQVLEEQSKDPLNGTTESTDMEGNKLVGSNGQEEIDQQQLPSTNGNLEGQREQNDGQKDLPQQEIWSGKWNTPQVMEVLFCIWVAGSILVLFYMAIVNSRLYVSLKKNRVLFDEVDSSLPVYLVEGIPTPCLYGRTIYIPAELAGQEEKLHHVLTHETVHYRHWDGLWGIVRGICVAVYWWHPLVWVCAYLSKHDCEFACDEAVICDMGELQRISYGKTVLSLAKIKGSTKDYFSMAMLLSGGGKKMKKRITRIAEKRKGLGAAVVLVAGLLVLGLGATVTTAHSSDNAKQPGSSEQSQESTDQLDATAQPSDTSKQQDISTLPPEKGTSSYGWQVNENLQLLHEDKETGKTEVEVELSHFSMYEECIGRCFVDENTAYLAYLSPETLLITVQYTTDGGKNWEITTLTGQMTMGVGGISLSFADESIGYLLFCSEPAAGKMEKTLFVTKDGGKSFKKVADLDMRNHPCDMQFFTPEKGFLITLNYGEDPYMYQTLDGGNSWKPISVEIPEEERFSYVNGYSLEKKEGSKDEAVLILEGVGQDGKTYLKYRTIDGGKIWKRLNLY